MEERIKLEPASIDGGQDMECVWKEMAVAFSDSRMLLSTTEEQSKHSF